MWRLHYCVVWKHMGYIWYNAHYFINRELAFEKNRREGSVINNNKTLLNDPIHTIHANHKYFPDLQCNKHNNNALHTIHTGTCYDCVKAMPCAISHGRERSRETTTEQASRKASNFPRVACERYCLYTCFQGPNCHNVDCVGSSDQLHRTRDKIATISSLSRGFRGIFRTSAMRGLGHVALGRSAGEHPWPAMFWHITIDGLAHSIIVGFWHWGI